jgi:iron complex transport system permease protein
VSTHGHTREAVDFGARSRRLRLGPLQTRIDLRAATICLVALAIAVVVSLVALALGKVSLSVGEVIGALVGNADRFTYTVVVEWRGPRVVAAVVLGAALGVSGAVFQSLTRNPLASPDIIGFSSGSYTGALIVIILIGGSYLQTAAGALLGGLLTAAVVYLFAYRQGVQGFRLIVVGIAISSMLASLNTWMMLTADLDVAMSAAWGAGSLNAIGWQQTGVATIVVAVLLVLVVLLSRPLHQLEMGDDAAKALGVAAEPSRLALMVVGVALTATVTAAAGPISFVALAAPQIAKRLTRTPGTTVAGAGCLGALLLSVSDLAAQHLFPVALPVGVITVVVGGCYLVWLLIREVRRHA